jgi:hypothetical protein
MGSFCGGAESAAATAPVSEAGAGGGAAGCGGRTTSLKTTPTGAGAKCTIRWRAPNASHVSDATKSVANAKLTARESGISDLVQPLLIAATRLKEKRPLREWQRRLAF